MATIKPSIYVGIGGTGITAIAKTKKMFEDAYGKDELLNMPIRFVCIDYDKTSMNDPKNATDISDDFIETKTISNPRQTYIVQSANGKYKWFFPQNLRVMDEKVEKGAGQVRCYGRFLTEMIMDSIESKLQTAYNNVKQISQDIAPGAEDTTSIDFHIAMSIAGGTGCGSFLNVAWKIRQLFENNVTIFGYGVSWGVFRAMDPLGKQTPNVISNAYSALLDLDYLQSASINEPITISLNNREHVLNRPLYDYFYVIDNQTTSGKVVKQCDTLCDVLGTCLFAAGGAVGQKVDSIYNNVDWKKVSAYNVSPKRGWASSLGACQVVYNGSSLAEIYAQKASLEILKQLLDSDSDTMQKAISWTEQYAIREDGSQYNMLTDAIYAPEKINAIRGLDLDTKDSIEEIKNSVKKYLSVLPEFPADADTSMTKSLVESLTDTLRKMMQTKNAIGNAKGFLADLRTLVVGYKSEMENESNEFVSTYTQQEDVLFEKRIKDYEAESKRLFKTKNSKAEDLNVMVEKPAKRILQDKIQAERRKVAYKIFVQLIAEIDDQMALVQKLEDKLTKYKGDLRISLAERQRAAYGDSIFQIDLAATERVNMAFDESDVHINAFFEAIKGSLLDFDPEGTSIEKAIENYTHNSYEVPNPSDPRKMILKRYAKEEAPFMQYDIYKDRLIDDVIADMKENAPVEYEKLKQRIDVLADTFMQINDRGLLDANDKAPSQKINHVSFICHYDRRNENGDEIKCTFEKDKRFAEDAKVAFLRSDSDYFRQRMIFYRSDFCFIPYCIASFTEHVVEREYESVLNQSASSTSDITHPHFDKVLFEEMKKKDWKLKPEMKDEAMFYWVCGNVLDFGFEITEPVNIMEKDANGIAIKLAEKKEVQHAKYIRFYKGKYYYYNIGGKAVGGDGNWVSFNTADRKNAFDRFKVDVLPAIKAALASRIQDQLVSNGMGTYTQRIKELTGKTGDNVQGSDSKRYDYIDIEAVGAKNSVTLYSQRTQEAAQYDLEWDYIVNELENALLYFKK